MQSKQIVFSSNSKWFASSVPHRKGDPKGEDHHDEVRSGEDDEGAAVGTHNTRTRADTSGHPDTDRTD